MSVNVEQPMIDDSCAMVEINIDGNVVLNNLFDEDSLVNYFLTEDIGNIHTSGESPTHSSSHSDASFPSPSVSYPSSPSVVPHSSPFDSSMESPDSSGYTTNTVEYNDIINPFIVDHQQINTDVIPTFPAPCYVDDGMTSIEQAQSNIASPVNTLNSSSSYESNSNSSSSSEISEEKDKKQKKRPALEQRIQNFVHPLSREELLKLTGKEPVKIDPPVGNGDERQVKKQRRLVKNRESAQLSRMRKKIYIEDLEKKLSDVNDENTSLKEEVLYLQGIIKQFASSHPTLLPPTTANSLIDNSQQRGRNAKTAGVCLLLIIFSIGIFLNPQPQSNPSFTSSLVASPRGSQPSTDARSILAIEESKPVVVPDEENVYLEPQTPPTIPNLHDNSLVLSTQTLKRNQDDARAPVVSDMTHNKKRIRIVPQEEDEDIPLRLPPTDDASLRNQVAAGLNFPPSTGGGVESHSHSSYIICSDTPRIVSTNLSQTTENIFNSNPSSPLSIGLLIPSDSLGLNVTGIPNMPQERSILEISCQVQNIRVWNPIAQELTSDTLVIPTSSYN
eukprot:gene8009-9409_t